MFQIGAREHYAIPRALHASGDLAFLFSDFWISDNSILGRLPFGKKLQDRFHSDLNSAQVLAPNLRMLTFEFGQRMFPKAGWSVIEKRNLLFQKLGLNFLKSRTFPESTVLFSYSYAAKDLFKYAKSLGWRTVLGQIDPGPEEERIVAAEQKRYSALNTNWQPAPAGYWDSWREEVDLADLVVVNSEWSFQCLLKEGVAAEKMKIIPLVYQNSKKSQFQKRNFNLSKNSPYQILFLGQINLRKGVERLLDAMRLLNNENIELKLVGSSEIPESAWSDLPNVRWLGPCARSEVHRLYQSADVFILPTLSDGFALTQLEALSEGIPVIASRNCGSVVTHGVNGWILEDLRPETIASCIRRSMEEPLRHVSAPQFSLSDLASELQK